METLWSPISHLCTIETSDNSPCDYDTLHFSQLISIIHSILNSDEKIEQYIHSNFKKFLNFSYFFISFIIAIIFLNCDNFNTRNIEKIHLVCKTKRLYSPTNNIS